MVSFVPAAPVPGAPHPPGAMRAALGNLCLSVDESQPGWIKGVEKHGWLIKANQPAFLCT